MFLVLLSRSVHGLIQTLRFALKPWLILCDLSLIDFARKLLYNVFFFHKKIMNKSRNLSICFDSFRMLVCSWQKKKWHLNKAYWRELSVILPAHVRKIASIIAHYNHKFDMAFCLTKQLNSLSERLGLLPVKHGLLGHKIEVWGIWPVP